MNSKHDDHKAEWVLVPRVPTQEWRDTVANLLHIGDAEMDSIHAALLAAAPAASEGEDGAVAWAVVFNGKVASVHLLRDDAESQASVYGSGPTVSVEPLTRPAAQVAVEPSCPDCKAPGVLYECVWCSANNYPPQVAATPKPRCGNERHELDAYIWKRDSEQEWVLEISGEINGTSFISRHTEPLTTPPEDVAGLPSLYERLEAATPKHDEGRELACALDKSARERAMAWDAVVALLDELSPHWIDHPGTGIDAALNTIRALATQPAARRVTARPLAEYHEDYGPVTWWTFPVQEAPWIGAPDDSDWPGYHTHFTPCPEVPESFAQPAEGVSE